MSSIKQLFLQDLGDLRSGYSSRKKMDVVPELATHWLLPIRAINDSFQGVISKRQLEPIFFEGDGERYTLKNGDILISIRGKFEATFIEDTPPNTFVLSNWVILSPTKEVDGLYFMWWFNHPRTQSILTKNSQGSSLYFMSMKELKGIEVPLPSEQQQQYIGQLYQLRKRERKLIQNCEYKRDQLFNETTYKLILGT